MGKVTMFRILLDDCDSIRAGDTVTGRVKIELRDDLLAKEVRVSFTGMCTIQWAEAQKSSSLPEMNSVVVDPVVVQEVYFSYPLKLWTPGRIDNHNDDSELETNNSRPASLSTPTSLTKGTHTMEFEFRVPETSPSSFQGLNGCVEYKLKAVIEMATKKGVKPAFEVTTRTVTVASNLDLNDVCDARESIDLSRDLKASTFLLPSVDCGATMRLARKGFTPGEIIPVEFSVRNNASHATQSASLLLKMIIQYKAGDRRCECERLLDKSVLGKVPASTTVQGLDKNLRVPVTCQPTGLPGCSLINIQYRLELKIKPSCLSLKRLRLHSDVIVGTPPLSASSVYDSPPDYWSCYLPSYEEIMTFAPPPYSPETPSPTRTATPTSSSSSSSSTHPPPELPVSSRSGSRLTTPDNLRRSTKNTSSQTLLRQNSCPTMNCNWNPLFFMLPYEFDLL